MKKRFPGISSRAYEHPADRAALMALRRMPGFDVLVRKLFGAWSERSLRLAFLASSVRVGERQLPDLHRLHLEACEILDISPLPDLFVSQTPLVNAGAIGLDRPFIVLNSGLLSLLDAEEIQFVLGHELSHILSGHALYKTVLRLLLRMSTLAFSVPLGRPALMAITAALLEWDRRSELSADRAGLLVAQKAETADRSLMKLAGGLSGLNREEFLAQARDYNSAGAALDSLAKLLNLIGQPHPFPVIRVAELEAWRASGGYERILGGEFPARSSDAESSPRAEWKAVVAHYGSGLRGEFSSRVEVVSDAARQIGRRFLSSLRGEAPLKEPRAARRKVGRKKKELRPRKARKKPAK